MEIKLNRLTLENFKGIPAFSLDLDGKNATILGENGAGKTTIFDSFLWLIFNKDSQGKADFAIKTLDAQGQEIHNLNHSVEAVLTIDDAEITLSKVLTEKWTKKRGTPKPSFSGHTTDFYIDGVPVQKKDWDFRIQGLIEEDIFKLLTSPSYFNSLHWQKRRALLLQVCGDISDADVIKSNHDLAALPDLLKGRSLEDHKKVVDGKKKEINKRLQEIPARIDELTKSMADTSGYDILTINARIAALGIQIQAMKDNTGLSSLRKEKADLEAKLSEAKRDLTAAIRAVEQDGEKGIDTLESEHRKAKSALLDIQADLSNTELNIQHNEKEMDRLRKEFKEISAQEFKGESTCPTCGQPLPGEQVQAAITRHNEIQAQRLGDINQHGKDLKEKTQKLLEDKKLMEKDKVTIETKISDLSTKILEAKQGKILSVSHAGQKETKAIEEIQGQISAIATRINENPPADTSLLEADLKAEQGKLAALDHAKKTKERIAVLGDEEKNLAASYEELERQTFLMEQFIVAKVGMLEDKINGRFSLARFKMYETQINGGVSECCETLYHGTPYNGGLSTGEQIVIGLDILKTLQEYYKIKAPCWLDHRESLTSEPIIECQLISLVADENIKKLEVRMS